MLKSLITMVARDGVEPPTPAFSGLASIALNPFEINVFTFPIQLFIAPKLHPPIALTSDC